MAADLAVMPVDTLDLEIQVMEDEDLAIIPAVCQLCVQDDHGDTVATATEIDVPLGQGAIGGTLETLGDHDWFQFEAQAGHTYNFETLLTGLHDSVITIRDANLTVLASNDDIDVANGNLASSLEWSPLRSGTYSIEVSGFADAQTGGYLLHWDVEANHDLSFVYPGDGQDLDYGGTYTFAVTPVANAEGYMFGFYQNGQLVTYQYNHATDPEAAEFAIHPGDQAHADVAPGNAQVYVWARVDGQWTAPSGISINLEVSDDHGNGPASATPINVGDSVRGDLEANGDHDVFSVDV
ncbi:MAG: PPC domain-containing protein, partial [Planctomycetales bacterium]|nr:PPC domain-containing protein [Planctomycetales bacterium]